MTENSLFRIFTRSLNLYKKTLITCPKQVKEELALHLTLNLAFHIVPFFQYSIIPRLIIFWLK